VGFGAGSDDLQLLWRAAILAGDLAPPGAASFSDVIAVSAKQETPHRIRPRT
jgi:hypothetical protein